MGGWATAIGGYLKDRVENKLANKLDPSQTQNPNQPPSMQQAPDPMEDTLGYAKYRAQQTPLGRAISGVQQRYRQQHQPDQPQPAPAAPMPEPQSMGDPNLAGLQPEMMAQGKIVTRPTTAILGERGPEAVVPLNDNPQNHVTPAILNSLTPRYRGGSKLRLRVPHVR